ncbi:uncharacterized protein LOC143023999 isoform X1 [Oratosquilla oratoria]|uniref:uncharacterized protein LOC143023999 isoform X1 n=1 Tax=Oratosquilla oratoria TaxID=337810 RepID=UPI003F76763D
MVKVYFRRRTVLDKFLVNIIEVGAQRTLRVEVAEDTLDVVLSSEDPDHNQNELLRPTQEHHCTLSKNDETRSSSSQTSIANKPNENKEIFRFSLPLQKEKLDSIIYLVLPSSRGDQNLTLGVDHREWTCDNVWRSKARTPRCLIVRPQESDIGCIVNKSSEFRPISNYGAVCLRNWYLSNNGSVRGKSVCTTIAGLRDCHVVTSDSPSVTPCRGHLCSVYPLDVNTVHEGDLCLSCGHRTWEHT